MTSNVNGSTKLRALRSARPRHQRISADAQVNPRRTLPDNERAALRTFPCSTAS